MPEELLDEDEEMDLDEEEEARAMDLLTRYNKILNTLTDNCMKSEQLSVNMLRILLYLVSKSMARASSSSSKSISSYSSKSSSGKSRASHSSLKS